MKLDLRDRAEAVVPARETGLVQPDSSSALQPPWRPQQTPTRFGRASPRWAASHSPRHPDLNAPEKGRGHGRSRARCAFRLACATSGRVGHGGSAASRSIR